MHFWISYEGLNAGAGRAELPDGVLRCFYCDRRCKRGDELNRSRETCAAAVEHSEREAAATARAMRGPAGENVRKVLAALDAEDDAEDRAAALPIRWRRLGLAGDLDACHAAEVLDAGLVLCTLRVTRSRVPCQARGRWRTIHYYRWLAVIVDADGSRLDVPGGRTLARAKANAESELRRRLVERRAANHAGRA